MNPIMNSCSICFKNYTKYIICISCKYFFCKDCVILYFSEKKDSVNCPNCLAVWTSEFISLNLPKKFVTKYNKINKDSYFEAFKTKILSFQNDLDNYNSYNEFNQKLKVASNDRVRLRKEKNKLQTEMSKDPEILKLIEDIHAIIQKSKILSRDVLTCRYHNVSVWFNQMRKYLLHHNNMELFQFYMDSYVKWNKIQEIKKYDVKMNKFKSAISDFSREPYKNFRTLRDKYLRIITNHNDSASVVHCPNVSCTGTIVDSLCNQCHKKICKHCNNISQNDKHECRKEDILSLEAIKKDSIECPNCFVKINKISGCDQMWCTNCNNAFDWKTGSKIMGKIHNPHYFEWLKSIQKHEIKLCNLTTASMREVKKLMESQYKIVSTVLDSLNKAITFVANKLTEKDFFKNIKNTRCIYQFLNKEINKTSFTRKFTSLMKKYEFKLEIIKIINLYMEICQDIIATCLWYKFNFLNSKDLIATTYINVKKECNARFKQVEKDYKSKIHYHFKNVENQFIIQVTKPVVKTNKKKKLTISEKIASINNNKVHETKEKLAEEDKNMLIDVKKYDEYDENDFFEKEEDEKVSESANMCFQSPEYVEENTNNPDKRKLTVSEKLEFIDREIRETNKKLENKKSEHDKNDSFEDVKEFEEEEKKISKPSNVFQSPEYIEENTNNLIPSEENSVGDDERSVSDSWESSGAESVSDDEKGMTIEEHPIKPKEKK